MKRRALLAVGILLCSTASAIAQPQQADAASAIHLRVGQTVYAASSRSIAYALCETPPGAKPWQGTFPKPKLDANGVPKVLFSYQSGAPLKVVSMHLYTWSFEGNANAEKFWTMETRDHHRFCLRESQVDSTVVQAPH